MIGALPAAITAVLAVVVICGGVAGVAFREQRPAALGLMVALAAAPFLADPMPDPRGIAARIAGAALVAYLFLMASRDEPDEPPPVPLTWPAGALFAATAAVAAIAAVWGTLPVVAAPGSSLPEAAGAPLSPLSLFVPAAAAGTALLVLAAAPVLVAQAPLRLAGGLVLAATGTSLLLASVVGPASPLTDLCVALLLVAIAGAGGLLHRISRDIGSRPSAR